MTGTLKQIVSTDVTGCFCTAAGVWTDVACFAYAKNAITTATPDAIVALIEKLTPKTWQYKPEVHGDDLGRQRVGIVYDDLPQELLAPGDKQYVNTGVLSSFALAAIRYLYDQNQALQERLAKLETA